LAKNNDSKTFFGILIGIFGIFLLWTSYSTFLQTGVLDFLSIIIPFIAGLFALYGAYKFINK